MSRYYRICCANVGKIARIRTRDGRDFTGRIVRVTPRHVHLVPMGRRISGTELGKKHPPAVTAETTKKKESGSEILFFPFIVPLAAIIGLTIIGTAPYWGGYGGGFYW